MGCYNRISFEEREKIYLLQKNDKTQLEIAFTLGRSQSSISYELARCKSDACGYLPVIFGGKHAFSFGHFKEHYKNFIIRLIS